MRPTNNIGYLLNHLAFVLGRQSDQVLQERLGIGFSQFKIMMTLQWKPNIQQKHIAEKLGQTEASISRQIKLLLEQGMLQTTVNPANRREHITVLTAKGERLTDEAMSVLNSYHAPVFGTLNEKQQAALLETLTILHGAACRSDRPGACHQTDSN
jgi:DNA-binding MarR family transcriptional regulator